MLRLLVAIPLVFALAVGDAWAYWSAGSVPGGGGASAATTVNRGATPTASGTGSVVTLSWAASTLSNGNPVAGYIVKRYDLATLTLQTILSACTGTVTATGCTENSVPTGQWVYSVTPVFATNWRGVESLKSTTVTTDATPPVNAISAAVLTGNAAKSSNTIFYRGVAAGSFTLTNAVSDAGTGPASSTTAALSGTPTGWTHSPSTVSTPPGGPYVSNPFSWTASATSAPTEVVTGRDVAGNTATTTLSFINDSTAPTPGTVTYPNGTTTSTSLSVSFTTGTDGGSGIGTRLLQRASATLTGSTCGSFGAFATLTNGTNPTSPLLDTVSRGTCYTYQYVVSDNVGNQNTTTSASVVQVLTYLNTITTTTGLVNYWRLGETTTSSDSFTGTAAATLQTHTGEIGATWTKHPISTPDAVITTSGRIRRNGAASSTSGAVYYSSATPTTANYTVNADVYVASVLTGDLTGVVGRLDPANSSGTFYAAVYDQSTGSWTLYSVVNSSKVSLGSSAQQTLTAGTTYRLALDMTSSTIRLLVNGVQQVSVTNTAITAAGRSGVAMGFGATSTTATDTTGMHLDNFTVTPPLADSKGTNTGDYLNGPTLGVAGAIAGDPNTAARFDGVSDFGTVARQISDDFSIEFWFNSTQGTGTGTAWSQGAGLVDAYISGTSNDFGVSLRQDGKVVAGVGTPDVSIVSSSGGYNNGNWHHVVFTRTKTTGALQLYVDGALTGSATGNTASLTSPTNINFGRIQTGNNYFSGTLDEIAVYT
ncbi:MAG: LamG-like jellyroll fold domain-containing protein, partial [Mycobacteriaceae bacterium]